MSLNELPTPTLYSSRIAYLLSSGIKKLLEYQRCQQVWALWSLA